MADVRHLPQPSIQLGAFRGTPHTVDEMIRASLGDEGERSYKVRHWAERITRWLAPKDYLSEILALRTWATPHPAFGPLRYTNDQLHVEMVKTPWRILTEIEQSGRSLVDCDDIACLLAAMGMALGRKATFVIAAFGGNQQYTHVFARLLEPRSGKWIVVDPVAGSKERQMLLAITKHKIYEIDS